MLGQPADGVFSKMQLRSALHAMKRAGFSALEIKQIMGASSEKAKELKETFDNEREFILLKLDDYEESGPVVQRTCSE